MARYLLILYRNQKEEDYERNRKHPPHPPHPQYRLFHFPQGQRGNPPRKGNTAPEGQENRNRGMAGQIQQVRGRPCGLCPVRGRTADRNHRGKGLREKRLCDHRQPVP